MSVRRRVLCCVSLFLLAPYFGEYVLGNQPLTALPEILLLAPMYGGGALIIREVGRRTRSGWPVMGVLAVAYALVEEGLIDQMIFNPAYLGLPSFDGFGPIPILGISATLTLESVALHAIGSTCVPIAVAEAFDHDQTSPWLGRTGLGFVVAVFVVGSTGLAVLQASQLRFVGSAAQFGVTSAVVAGLIVVAARLAPRRPRGHTAPPARSPRSAGLMAFAVTTGFWLVDMVVPSITSAWVSVTAGALVLAVGTVLLVNESRREGWTRQHRFAVAAGALSTYLWLAFINTVALGVPIVLGVVGNTVFGASAVGILLVAARADRRGSAVPVFREAPTAASDHASRRD